MKQALFEVLVYLFNNYVEKEVSLPENSDQIIQDLQNAGFAFERIEEIYQLLHNLTNLFQHFKQPVEFNDNNAFRVLNPIEQLKLDTKNQGLLILFEQLGILEPKLREAILEQVLLSDSSFISAEELKGLIMIVLMKEIPEIYQHSWMSSMLLPEQNHTIH